MSAQVAQSLLNLGLSKPALYKFEIPRSPLNNNFGANGYLEYYCKSVTLPEITHDVMLMNGHSRQGVVTSQPYGIKYSKPLTIDVIERSDFHSYKNFQDWFKKTATNTFSVRGVQKMNYRMGYTCDIILTKLELATFDYLNDERKGRKLVARNLEKNDKNLENGFRKVWKATFVNSYITSIGDMQFSSDAKDAMLEYNVQFYYDTYDVVMYKDGL